MILGGLVSVSFALRVAAALAHVTPRYFPDEYIYSSLARSISHGELSIRGTPAAFPALLQPILAAPFWLIDDVDTAFRLTQAMHALAISLTAVPVYLLARQLRLSPWQRLSSAALVLVLPSFVYSAYLTADAVALPLAIGAIAAGAAALDRPTARSQIAFVSLCGLATFARVQYVVLPIAFVAAALVLSGGRPLETARRLRVSLALLGVAVLAGIVTGPGRLLGYYDAIFDLSIDFGGISRWAAIDLMLLPYAAGIVLVPGAAVGIAAGLVRPRSQREHAFAALTAALTVLLLLEAAVYASNGSERFQERYLIAITPLVPLLFFLGARRFPERRAVLGTALVSIVLLLVALRIPLSGYTADFGKQDSPLLQAAHRLEAVLGVGGGALLVSSVAGALALFAAAAAVRPRLGVGFAIALCAATLIVISAGAISYDIQRSRLAMTTFLENDPGWVDASELGDVAVLLTPGSLRAAVSEQLFWNRSLTSLLRLPTAAEVDVFGSRPVRISRDGRLVSRGGTIREPLLVQEYAGVADFSGARLVHRGRSTALWVPEGTPRVRLLTDGRYLDGWLAAASRVTIWPGQNAPRTGSLHFVLSLPSGLRGTVIDLSGPGLRTSVRLGAGDRKSIVIPVTARVPWTLTLRTQHPYLVPVGRLVAAQSSPPTFVETQKKR